MSNAQDSSNEPPRRPSLALEQHTRWERNQSQVNHIRHAIRYGHGINTGRRDQHGRMVVYYSIGLEGVAPEIAERIRTRGPAITGRYGFAPPEYAVSPEIQSIFGYARHQFEQTINVVFRPIQEAPAGTTPNIVLGTFHDPTYYGAAPAPFLLIDPEDFSNANTFTRMEKMLHEMGHRFGLKHSRYEGAFLLGHDDNATTTQTVMSEEPGGLQPVTLMPADIEELQRMYGRSPTSLRGRVEVRPESEYGALSGSGGRMIAVDAPNGIELSAANYVSPDPSTPEDSTRPRVEMDADAGINFDSFDRLVLTRSTHVNALIGSQYNDSMTTSSRYPTRMAGGDGHDNYSVLALPPGLAEHQVFETGTNNLNVATGARVAVHYQGEGPHETSIALGFNIRSVNVMPLGSDSHVTLLLMSQTSDKPTIIRLPLSDQQVVENRLSIWDFNDSTPTRVDLSSVTSPGHEREEPPIIVTAQRTPGNGHSR